MNTMRICMLILWAISNFGGSIYAAYMGVILHKEHKTKGSILLISLAVIFFVFSLLLVKAI